MRRKAKSGAQVLLGYLPISKLHIFSKSRRSLEIYCLFHLCLKKILAPLKEAGTNGVEITCADGYLRRVWPILAAYIADHPEQCLVSCCQENRCPQCKVDADQRGDPIDRERKEVLDILDILRDHNQNLRPYEFETLGLRAVHEPFWGDLPHCDIFSCFTPDILHQLHKGVFKEHLVKWCSEAATGGADEIDRRFMRIPSHLGLRHFKKGVSTISQWTGNEYKQMEKVFVAIAAGSGNANVTQAAQAALDFIYLSRLQLHTTSTLGKMKAAFDQFHENKHVFTELEIRENFDIPKIHSMQHYISRIVALGTAEGFSTEAPERLHIEYAKEGYRASNRRDHIAQMTVWLRRREALTKYSNYLDWKRTKLTSGDSSDSDNSSSDSESESATSDSSDTDHEDTAQRRRNRKYRRRVRRKKAAHHELQARARDGVPVNNVLQPTALQSAPHRRAPDPQHTTSVTYWIRKQPATRDTGVRATDIIERHGAKEFISAINFYLDGKYPYGPLRANIHDRFDIFRRLVLRLPMTKYMPELSDEDLKDRIRASPAQGRVGRRPAKPAQFDTVLVTNTAENFGAFG